MTWILLSIFSAFCYASIHVIDKSILGKYVTSEYEYMIFSAIGTFVVATLLFITGFANFSSWQEVSYGLALGLMLGVASLIYCYALVRIEAVVVAAIFQLIPFFILLLEVCFNKQLLFFNQYVGFIGICIVSIFISLKGASIRNVNFNFFGFCLSIIAALVISLRIYLCDQYLKSYANSVYNLTILDAFGYTFFCASLLLKKSIRAELGNAIRQAYANKFLAFFSVDLLDFIAGFSLKNALIFGPSAAFVSVLLGFTPLFVLLLSVGIIYIFRSSQPKNYSFNAVIHPILAALSIIGFLYLVVVPDASLKIFIKDFGH
jgi:uncharacterized membrane protein